MLQDSMANKVSTRFPKQLVDYGLTSEWWSIIVLGIEGANSMLNYQARGRVSAITEIRVEAAHTP